MEIKLNINIDDRLIGLFKQALSRRTLLAVVGAAAVASSLVYAGVITKPYSFSDGAVISASQVNSNFDTLFSEVNAKETRISTLEAASWTRTGNNLYYNTGSVGIGKTPSSATLDVNGTINGSYEGFSYYATSSVYHPAGWGPVVVGVLDFNTFGTSTYNTSTGTFTAPKAGYYRFVSHGYIPTASSNPDRLAVGIYKNGGLRAFSGGQFSAGDTPGPQFAHVVYLNAGDTVQLWAYTAINCYFSSGGGGHYWWFQGEYLGR